MGGTKCEVLSFVGVRIVEANMIWPEWITVAQCQNESEERNERNIHNCSGKETHFGNNISI